MRRLLLLLVALGLWQIAYAQVHCGLEPADCNEGKCELCHLSDLAPLIASIAAPSSPTPTLRPAPALNRRPPLGPPPQRSRGRAPPR